MLQLRDLRKQRNITMKQLGDIIGVGESTISQYENGKRQPDYETLHKIANYFDVSIDYLIGNMVDPEEIQLVREKVKELYSENDINVTDLEKKLETNYTTFRAWMNGYGDYFNTASELLKLASLFNVSVDYLLGNTDQPDRDPAPSPVLSPEEQTLVENYRALDSAGKGKASDYLDDLAKLYGLHKQEIPGGYAFTDPGTELTEDDMKEFEE